MIPMRPKLIHHRFFVFVALLAASLAFPQLSKAAGGPDDFIRTVGQNAIDSLTDKAITQDQREDRFRKILNAQFEVTLLARFTLGRFWRRASEQAAKRIHQAFRGFYCQSLRGPVCRLQGRELRRWKNSQYKRT